MNWKIPLFKIYWNKDDINAVSSIIKKGSCWALGPEIKEFEEKIAQYIGTQYAVTFNSGTSALYAMMIAYGIKQGDEVIIPSFTFIATANSVLMVNAKPVFADIERNTYGLDIESVKEKITSKTKAIMPIHYGGCPALYTKELKELAEDHNLLFFEDAAQSFGAKIGKQKVGTFGDASMFSFCQDKVLALGEGGVIVTDNKDIYEKLKLIRSHGRADSKDYFSSNEIFDYITLGYNFRMPTILAALGISQLNKIDKIITKRKDISNLYNLYLSKIVKLFSSSNVYCVYQKYPIEIDNRDDLKKHLEQKKIMTRSYFDLPVHHTKFYKEKFEYGKLPITDEISLKILNLPIYPNLKSNEIEYIIKSIQELCN